MVVNGAEVWQDAVVVETRDVAANIRRIVLEPRHPVPAEPGTHIDLTFHIGGERVSFSEGDCADRPKSSAPRFRVRMGNLLWDV